MPKNHLGLDWQKKAHQVRWKRKKGVGGVDLERQLKTLLVILDFTAFNGL